MKKQRASRLGEANKGDQTIESDFYFYLDAIYYLCPSVNPKKSLQLDIAPDNPSPYGRINCVVKGVTIYEREK